MVLLFQQSWSVLLHMKLILFIGLYREMRQTFEGKGSTTEESVCVHYIYKFEILSRSIFCPNKDSENLHNIGVQCQKFSSADTDNLFGNSFKESSYLHISLCFIK